MWIKVSNPSFIKKVSFVKGWSLHWTMNCQQPQDGETTQWFAKVSIITSAGSTQAGG